MPISVFLGCYPLKMRRAVCLDLQAGNFAGGSWEGAFNFIDLGDAEPLPPFGGNNTWHNWGTPETPIVWLKTTTPGFVGLQV